MLSTNVAFLSMAVQGMKYLLQIPFLGLGDPSRLPGRQFDQELGCISGYHSCGHRGGRGYHSQRRKELHACESRHTQVVQNRMK
jgi:hypothetical protein